MQMKMYSMKYADILMALIKKELEIYEANCKSNVSLKRTILAQQFSTITEWIFKVGFTIYVLAGMFYLLNPLYSYFWLGEIVPIVPIYVPYFDEHTTGGFISLTILHLVIIILTVVASAAADFMFIILIFNMIFFARIFADDVNELNDTLRADKADRILAKGKLTNSLLIHREIFEFVFHFIYYQ